ncbi:hypothetical protein PXNS11_260070 [Stutzerimonas xanthomarina]|nr:hypothetical protein PXNS11_260070 [Stutzerimonas xanthomarina]
MIAKIGWHTLPEQFTKARAVAVASAVEHLLGEGEGGVIQFWQLSGRLHRGSPWLSAVRLPYREPLWLSGWRCANQGFLSCG